MSHGGQVEGVVSAMRDVTERKRGEEERERLIERVQGERNRLRVLIDTAPVGIAFYAAPGGSLELVNKAAEELLGQPLAPGGVPLAEVPARYSLYRPSGELLSHEELPSSRALRGDICLNEEVLVRQPSGREAYVVVNAAPLRDGQEQVVGAVVVFQDITALKEQERLRDEFLSAAAHELKTPVTTIKGYAQMLRSWAPEGHEPREGRAFEVVAIQCDRITRRVQEMLAVTQFRTAPPELRRVRFDLGELAAEMARWAQPAAEAYRLIVQREGVVPVEADRERLEEVLTSLLDNAIRYSPAGGDVEVRVAVEGGEAVLSVTDHGVGIAGERQPHIFEPFYEPVPAGAHGYSGVVPLSLYLAKLTIERHKGRIWVESEVGKGSTFSFSLPLASACP
jgi:signal transduction histidine kinase